MHNTLCLSRKLSVKSLSSRKTHLHEKASVSRGKVCHQFVHMCVSCSGTRLKQWTQSAVLKGCRNSLDAATSDLAYAILQALENACTPMPFQVQYMCHFGVLYATTPFSFFPFSLTIEVLFLEPLQMRYLTLIRFLRQAQTIKR